MNGEIVCEIHPDIEAEISQNPCDVSMAQCLVAR
jgi:hypothetical protein